eukprot:COSAG02_NODE_1324_length_13239_cov_12.346804_12_plen_192_part_00
MSVPRSSQQPLTGAETLRSSRTVVDEVGVAKAIGTSQTSPTMTEEERPSAPSSSLKINVRRKTPVAKYGPDRTTSDLIFKTIYSVVISRYTYIRTYIATVSAIFDIYIDTRYISLPVPVGSARPRHGQPAGARRARRDLASHAGSQKCTLATPRRAGAGRGAREPGAGWWSHELTAGWRVLQLRSDGLPLL